MNAKVFQKYKEDIGFRSSCDESCFDSDLEICVFWLAYFNARTIGR